MPPLIFIVERCGEGARCGGDERSRPRQTKSRTCGGQARPAAPIPSPAPSLGERSIGRSERGGARSN